MGPDRPLDATEEAIGAAGEFRLNGFRKRLADFPARLTELGWSWSEEAHFFL